MAQPFSGIHRQIGHVINDSNEWNIKQIKYCTEDGIYDMNVPCFRAFVTQANVYYSDINEQPDGKCDELNNCVDNVTDQHIVRQSYFSSITDQSAFFSHIWTSQTSTSQLHSEIISLSLLKTKTDMETEFQYGIDFHICISICIRSVTKYHVMAQHFLHKYVFAFKLCLISRLSTEVAA